MKIFYVFYHEYERMPIHAVEVIEEMNRQGQQVVVVTAISRQYLQGLAWPKSIQVHQVPILHLRGLRMISFFLSSFLLMPYWCLKASPDIVYERFSLTSLATLWITRLLGIALVVEVNGIVTDELALSQTAGWRLHLQELVEGWVFRGSDHLITVTEGIRQWAGSDHSVPLEKIETIFNGTNPRKFKPFEKGLARQEFGLDPERPIVGYLGSLYPWCGLEHLIDASPMILEEIPDALFLIGGGQTEMKWEFERRAKHLGVEQHFVFQGEVPWDKAALFISTFDVAVAPAQFTKRTGISPLKFYAYLAAIIHKFGVSVDFLRKFRAESVFRCDYKASKLVEPNRDEARAPSGNSSARRGLYICVGAGSQGTVRWDTDGASVMRRAFVRDKTMPGAPRCDEKFPEPGHRF